jgi:hypothetical protein
MVDVEAPANGPGTKNDEVVPGRGGDALQGADHRLCPGALEARDVARPEAPSLWATRHTGRLRRAGRVVRLAKLPVGGRAGHDH